MASVIAPEGVFAMEFFLESRRRILSVSFWEGRQLVCMPLGHCRRDVPSSKKNVVLTSRLLSAVGGDATIICCGRANLDLLRC